MKQITAKATFRIKEGCLNDFKQVMHRMISAVKENEKGALRYDWFIDEGKMACVVIETYIDSAAVMAHVGNVGEQLQEISQYSELSLEVYGNPDGELNELIKNMGADSIPYAAGL